MIKTYTREDIIEDYKQLQAAFPDKYISRKDYRTYGIYPTSLIEKMFGSWSEFVKEIDYNRVENRSEIIKVVENTKVIITSILDGLDVDMNAFKTLKNVATWNNADLVILWSKSPKKGMYGLKSEVYNELKDYLATEVHFMDDSTIIAEDLSISYTCKKPLINLDKISKGFNLFIVAHPKQYHEMAPNDSNSLPRQLWSTGTISKLVFPKTVSGLLDARNSTTGGLFLEYNLYTNSYQVRNLEYLNGYVYDKIYKFTENNVVEVDNYVPAIVCGDIHFPEQDDYILQQTIDLINECNPKMVFLHDLFSLNSINHHELNKPLTRLLRQTEITESLEKELKTSIKLLKYWFLDRFPDITFFIVASNHDNFIYKWLDSGEYLHDRNNAIIGHEMWARVARGNHPISDMIDNTNIVFLNEKDSLQPVSGIECANHGHLGIAGAKGNSNAYNKTYDKAVIGHSHSSKIFENTVTVGTNSLLELKYTGPIMNWSHANAIIFPNSAIQLVLID